MAKDEDRQAREDEDEPGLDEDEQDVEEKAAPRPAPRRPPARTRRARTVESEVSPLSAFLTAFVLLALIIAPVTGIVMYFMRSVESIISVFNTPEGTFMGGFAIGIAAAFVAAIVFGYKSAARA